MEMHFNTTIGYLLALLVYRAIKNGFADSPVNQSLFTSFCMTLSQKPALTEGQHDWYP